MNTIKKTRWVACAIMALLLQYVPTMQATVAVRAPGAQSLVQLVQRNPGWATLGLVGVCSWLVRRLVMTNITLSAPVQVAPSGATPLSLQGTTLPTDSRAQAPLSLPTATMSPSVPAPSLSSASVPTFDYGVHSPAAIQKVIDDKRLVAYFGPLKSTINTRIAHLDRQLTSQECCALSTEILARAHVSSSAEDAIISGAGIPLPMLINKLVSHQNNGRFTQETLVRINAGQTFAKANTNTFPTDVQNHITGILTGVTPLKPQPVKTKVAELEEESKEMASDSKRAVAVQENIQESESKRTAAVQERQVTTLNATAGIDTAFKRIPDILLTTLAHPAPTKFAEDLLPNAYARLRVLNNNALGVVFNDRTTLIELPSEWVVKQTIVNNTGTIVCCILRNEDCYLINTVTKQYFKIFNINFALCLTKDQQTSDTLILKKVAQDRSLLGDRLRRTFVGHPDNPISGMLVGAGDYFSSAAANNNIKISFKALEQHFRLELPQAIDLFATDSACRMQLDRASRNGPIVRPLAAQPWTVAKAAALKEQARQNRILRIKGSAVLVGSASIAALVCYYKIKEYVENVKDALLIARIVVQPAAFLSRLAVQSAGSLTTSAGIRVQSAGPMAEFAGSL